jgi:hypothetical protein
MTISRRSFFTESAALSLIPALLAHPELVEAMTANPTTQYPGGNPTAGETYWSNLYAPSDQQSRGEFSRAPNPDRDVRFLHYVEGAGLRWAEDIKLQELPSFNEDAVVTLELGGFRAGSLDTSRLAKVRFAQMHLSCQRISELEFFGPLAWATLATIYADKTKKLPAVTDLSALTTPGTQAKSALPAAVTPQLNRVLLSKGAGRISVNVSTTPPTSFLDKFLSTTVQVAKVVSPLLSFPAISLPALQAFYVFYGALEKALPENFLLNSAQRDVVVTQQGTDNNSVSMNALKLMTGTYFLIPKSHENDFAAGMDKLSAASGYLVPKDAPASTPPDVRLASAVPSVSYVSLNVKVQPLSAVTGSAT